jgi:hypothetical protein
MPVLKQGVIFVGLVIGSATYFHIRRRKLFFGALISACLGNGKMNLVGVGIENE